MPGDYRAVTCRLYKHLIVPKPDMAVEKLRKSLDQGGLEY
jgi:hypothetical protein